VVAAPAPEAHEKIIDLVAALKRSLDEKKGAAKPRRTRKPAKAKGPAKGGRSATG
jgi:non-homologous end joining protein Ku